MVHRKKEGRDAKWEFGSLNDFLAAKDLWNMSKSKRD